MKIQASAKCAKILSELLENGYVVTEDPGGSRALGKMLKQLGIRDKVLIANDGQNVSMTVIVSKGLHGKRSKGLWFELKI